jgi:hypothetical protein
VSDARERWRAQHRRARVRERRIAPIRRVAAPLVLVGSVAVLVLTVIDGYGWVVLSLALLYLSLRLYGIRPFRDGGIGGGDGSVGGDASGGF